MSTELKVTAHPSQYFQYGGGGLDIHAFLPPVTDYRQLAAERGAEGLAGELTAAARELPAVKKWRVLGEQLAAAERRVAEADRTFERAKAAKLLLEDNPEPDLAAKLREVEARVAAAATDKAAAEADLEKLRPVSPRPWAEAANAVMRHVSSRLLEHSRLSLWPRHEAAKAAFDAALERLKGVVEAAVREFVVGPVREYVVANHAAHHDYEKHDQLADRIMTAVVGPKPEGVLHAGRGEFQLATPKPAVPPPEPQPNPRVAQVR